MTALKFSFKTSEFDKQHLKQIDRIFDLRGRLKERNGLEIMLNIAVIMGRLTAVPELKTTNSGISVCSFSVAVDRNYSRAGGERQTDFINCVAWRQTAEFISKYFTKGSMIAINGSIQQRSYTDRDGNKRYAFEIVVDNANFCGSKAESGTGSGFSGNQEAPASFSNIDTGDFEEISMSDDDVPF